MKIGDWLRLEWDRLGAVSAGLLGVVTLIIGYVKISGTPYPAEQLPYILSGGVVGIGLLGLAATLWLSADMKDEWIMLDTISENLKELAASGPEFDLVVDRARPEPPPVQAVRRPSSTVRHA
jgi:hypothetical protein